MVSETRITPSEQLNATGTPSSTTYLRGDNSWSTPAGGVTGSTAPVSGDAAEWDTNLNLTTNNVIELMTGPTTVSAGTVTLTVASAALQLFTGSTTGQIVALPSTSVVPGIKYRLINNSSTAITVNASAGATVVVMAANTDCAFTAIATTPTTPAGWEAQYGGTTITVSAAGTLTLVGGNQCYVFSGTTAVWTLPPFAGNAGSNLILENRGSGNVTVNAAGSDHIYFNASVTTMTIAPGGSLPLINDGNLYWNAISLDLVNNAVGVLAVANGGTGVSAAGTSGNVLTSTGSGWASQAPAGGGSSGVTTQALSGTTLTMTISSTPIQVFTGSTQNQVVTLPNTAAGTPFGQQWLLINQATSTATVTCNASGTGEVVTLAPGTSAVVTATSATPTTVASWDVQYGGVTVSDGKVVNFANSLTFNGTDGTTMSFPAVTGNVVAPPTIATSPTSAIGATTTQVQVCSVQIPALTAVAGTTFKLRAWGVATSTATASASWQIHCGTANTISDTVVASATCLIGGQATIPGSAMIGALTIRATSATTGSCMASLTCFGNATSVATATTGMQGSTVAAAVNNAHANSTQTANATYTNSANAYVSLSVAVQAGSFNVQNAYVAYAGA